MYKVHGAGQGMTVVSTLTSAVCQARFSSLGTCWHVPFLNCSQYIWWGDKAEVLEYFWFFQLVYMNRKTGLSVQRQTEILFLVRGRISYSVMSFLISEVIHSDF